MLIDVLPGALEDYAQLRRTDPAALATVVAFLEEAEADSALIDKFTSHGDIHVGGWRANVKGWVEARKSDNLFRIRILDTPATVYRVVYGYDWHQRRIGVLAVRHKDEFDYEISGELADRIFRDWDTAVGGRRT